MLDDTMPTLKQRPFAPDVATRRQNIENRTANMRELGWMAYGLAAFVVGLAIGAALIVQGWVF
jgi:hypothetical protein